MNREIRKSMENLKSNWLLVVSAAGFFSLYTVRSGPSQAGLVLTILAQLWIFSRTGPVRQLCREDPVWLRLLSVLTALGAGLVARDRFYDFWGLGRKAMLLGTGCMALGTLAVSFWVRSVWVWLAALLRRAGIPGDLSRAEKGVYAGVLAVMVLSAGVLFLKTNAFYGTQWYYDVIYTSDSSYLVGKNAYLLLNNAENDLRQPMFAVFAAPFLGLAQLPVRLLHLSDALRAVLFNSIQIGMLFTANLMVTRILDLKPGHRMLWMLLSLCTYRWLLFSVMMEQYIVAWFWLMAFLLSWIVRGQGEMLAFWGAGGTLLTSAVIIPLCSRKNPREAIWGWLWDMLRYGLGFVVFLLACNRFDVLWGLAEKINTLGGFAGKAMSFSEKMMQYSHFVRNCFLAPQAAVTVGEEGMLAWRQLPCDTFSGLGLVLLTLAAVSAVVNRRLRWARLAGLWALFSGAILLVMGWGTRENGLILYALYFGWAFGALLFGLLPKAEARLGVRWLSYAVGAVTAGCMLWVNIPAFLEMVRFARIYYPV